MSIRKMLPWNKPESSSSQIWHPNEYGGESSSIPCTAGDWNAVGTQSSINYEGDDAKNFVDKLFGSSGYGGYEQNVHLDTSGNVGNAQNVYGYHYGGNQQNIYSGSGDNQQNVCDSGYGLEYEQKDDDDDVVDLTDEDCPDEDDKVGVVREQVNCEDSDSDDSDYVEEEEEEDDESDGELDSDKECDVQLRRSEPVLKPWMFLDKNEGDTAAQRGKWIMKGHPAYESDEDDPDTQFYQYGQGTLGVGSIYSAKSDFKREVVRYLLENKRGFAVERVHSKMYWFKCKKNDCPFRVRASGSSCVWRVYQFVEHTCEFNPTTGASHTLPSKQLGEILADKIVTRGQIMVPEAIRNELLNTYGLQVSYAQGRRIRDHGIAANYGTEDKSFTLLPSYLCMLQEANPGTETDLMVDPSTGQFKFTFFALGASIAGFCCARPFIAIDATHLKSKYRGILFVAVTKDANNQIFPLAFGVGGVESRESWSWFLQRVKHSLACPSGMLIVSDASKAISAAVSDVFPDAHHVLCCYHIQQNLVKYGKHVVELFKRAAWSYSEHEYNKIMVALEGLCPAAARHLKNVVGEERFARVKCQVRRYDIMTTNIVESMNSRLRWARRLPICCVLEAARYIVEQWSTNRYDKAMKSRGPLTDYATTKLRAAMEAGARMQVNRFSNTEYRVTHERKIYKVILSTQQCSCNVYQHELIPCAHAAAVIRDMKHDATAYVDEHYKLQHLREMWSGVISPVPNESDWYVPNGAISAICTVPDNPRQAGRPKMKRYPSGPEGSSRARKQQRCSRCGATSHNAKRCTVQMPHSPGVEQVAAGKPKRARKKCRLCRLEGHTAPRCPMRGHFDMNLPPNPE